MVVVASMADVSPVTWIKMNNKESTLAADRKFYSQACGIP
jgi:hypothetical protein